MSEQITTGECLGDPAQADQEKPTSKSAARSEYIQSLPKEEKHFAHLEPRNCTWCNSVFTPKNKKRETKYCCDKCRMDAYLANWVKIPISLAKSIEAVLRDPDNATPDITFDIADQLSALYPPQSGIIFGNGSGEALPKIEVNSGNVIQIPQIGGGIVTSFDHCEWRLFGDTRHYVKMSKVSANGDTAYFSHCGEYGWLAGENEWRGDSDDDKKESCPECMAAFRQDHIIIDMPAKELEQDLKWAEKYAIHEFEETQWRAINGEIHVVGRYRHADGVNFVFECVCLSDTNIREFPDDWVGEKVSGDSEMCSKCHNAMVERKNKGKIQILDESGFDSLDELVLIPDEEAPALELASGDGLAYPPKPEATHEWVALSRSNALHAVLKEDFAKGVMATACGHEGKLKAKLSGDESRCYACELALEPEEESQEKPETEEEEIEL